MPVTSPDDPTYVVHPVHDVDPDALRAAVQVAEPGALLMSLVHLTGDRGLLQEFGDLLAEERRRREGAGEPPLRGVYPPAVAEAVRERALALLGDALVPRLTVPDDELFLAMAQVCADDVIGREYTAHLREQSGFENARRAVPVTRRPEDFSVIVIGSGMVGLNAAVKLGEAGFTYRVLEARDELGGTWSRNTYPGAAVDTPSHFYSYSFELNPDWSKYYPTGPEYLAYLRHVADKYSLHEHISFGTTVLGCTWLEDEQVWEVTSRTTDGRVSTQRANAVVTATGVLNGASMPDVPGIETFRGTSIHTAEWRSDLDLTGKRVVVLGTGCTSVQVVASISPQVASLDVVLRQPHWVVPDEGVVQDVPDGMRWAMRNIPYFHQWFRLKTYWWTADKYYEIPRIDEDWYATHVSASPANDAVMQVCLDYLDRSFPDRPDLKAALTPDFPPFAKRLVKDPGFFRALTQEHVSVHRASFSEVRPDGVVLTDGQFLPADVVVWATGFKLEHLGFLDVVGRDGLTLAEAWADEDPRAYLGITVPGFPNLFVTAGPNAAPNHGGGHNVTSEEHVHYVVECLQYLVEHGLTSMEPTREATEAYNERVDAELDRTVWQHGGTANGYYRNASGRAWIACPWRLVDFWQMLREPAPEDYRFTAGPAEAQLVAAAAGAAR